MSPFKTIAAGVVLLLLASAGLIYVVARPKPMIQSSLPEELPAVEEQASPTPEPSPADKGEPQPTSPVVELQSHVPRIKTFAVELVSPTMAEKFVAPATIKLAARPNPRRGLTKIEFFTGDPGISVCQSMDPPDHINRRKIGEALSPPYEFSWTDVPKGVYKISAAAIYSSGEEQISDPKVIFVNETAQYEGPNWSGWRPPYSEISNPVQDVTLMPSPTPTPQVTDCPSIMVKRLDSSTGWTDPITFRAEVAGGIIPKDISYNWTVAGGTIVGEENTPTITVSINRILNKNLVASVEVRGLNAICSNTAFNSINFAVPNWMTEDKRPLLQQFKSGLEEVAKLKDQEQTQVYILTRGYSENCVDRDILQDARFLKRYLVEVSRLKETQVLIRNGGAIEDSEQSDLEMWIKSGEEVLNDALKQSTRRSVRPCRGFSIAAANYDAPRTFVNRTCPDVEDRIAYRTSLAPGHFEINTCPYNSKDPQNSLAQYPLHSNVSSGIYGNLPTFRYWTNGGNIRTGASTAVWDLSDVRLRPGIYNTVAMSDDGCACPSVDVATVEVKNFCTPCLTLTNWCGPDPAKQQIFHANVANFALAHNESYQWSTNKGIIISGQGTNEITVDTSMMAEGDEIIVTVGVGGLLRYCVNKLSITAIVGRCAPKVAKFDDFGNIRGPQRRARRRPLETVVTQSFSAEIPPDGSTIPQPDKVTPKLNEKEWMKVSWAPRVKTDESFPITVTYNRTTETVQVSNAPGEISEELKLGGRFKSLKERYGPNYETFAAAKLVVAGIECNNCDQEQYQSLDAEKVEWSWPVSPSRKGTVVFNIELWAKGEPRDKQSGEKSIDAEKVWSRNNLKVEVAEPLLTKNTVFAGGGLCAVLGLGLCFRGLRIYRIGDTYNVGQAVAVGRNVTMNNTTVNQQTDKNPDSGDKNNA